MEESIRLGATPHKSSLVRAMLSCCGNTCRQCGAATTAADGDGDDNSDDDGEDDGSSNDANSFFNIYQKKVLQFLDSELGQHPQSNNTRDWRLSTFFIPFRNIPFSIPHHERLETLQLLQFVLLFSLSRSLSLSLSRTTTRSSLQSAFSGCWHGSNYYADQTELSKTAKISSRGQWHV